MGKFVDATKDILSVFATAQWASEKIKTIPANFEMKTTETFVRMSVVFGGAGLNLKSTSGLLLVDIFTPANEGPLEAVRIADALDKCLVGKSYRLSTGTSQFSNSTVVPLGNDSKNPALSLSRYSIPFSHFGVV